MDYLEKPLPLDEFLSDNTEWKKLYELLYELIYNCELKLGDDWLGYTGDHLFLKGDDKIFIIDFGNITKNRSNDKEELYKFALKDVVGRVKNVDKVKNVNDEEKKIYIDHDIKERFIREGLSFLPPQQGGVLRKKHTRRVRRSRRKHTRRLRKKY
jgi:hypothetical protein